MKNGQFDTLLAEYESKVLKHPIADEKDYYAARIWMTDNNPLEQIVYDSRLAEPAFLPIHRGGRVYYGGDQAWFASKHHRDAGCGTVALADITAYAALHGGMAQLYDADPADPLSQAAFLRHMESTVQDLAPTVIGIPFVRWWREGGERFFQRRDVPLASWYQLDGPYRGEEGQLRAEAFLQYQIRQNRPVACLHWFGAEAVPVLNPRETPESRTANMNLHWVVVTAIGRENGEARITLSSCGSKYIFRLEDFLQGGPSFITPAFPDPRH